LLENSIGLVAHRFGMETNGTQFVGVLDIDRKYGTIVVHADLMECLHLTKMSCKGVIIQILKNTEWEIARVQNIDVSM